MACGPNCACDPGIECLSVVDPVRFGYFADWCNSGDEAKRRHVRNRSAMGITPEPAPAPAPVADPTPARAEPCRHLGEMTGMRECGPCGGKTKLKVFRCHHPNHAETTILECRSCPDYGAVPLTPTSPP